MDDSAEPLSDDAYLERIDDRINWRLTHCNLPIADLKYLVNTVRALTERAEDWEKNARAAQARGRAFMDERDKAFDEVLALTARVRELEGEVRRVNESARDEL